MSSPAANLPRQHTETPPLRFVTAASLFDGHDAAINIMRRLIQAQGAEVVHLGHNRSVEDVVRAALQEDADGIALSSYQGGHVEYFKYMVDMLRERGAPHIKVFGGGGGTITPEEIRELQDYGVERLYHPNDGMHMGLVPMIEDVVARARAGKRGQVHFSVAGNDQSTGHDRKHDSDPFSRKENEPDPFSHEIAIGRVLSAIEDGDYADAELSRLRKQWQLAGGKTPVIGITGTGGAGKSSVTDELLNRFLASFPKMHIAVISVDPTRRRTGGALLGDRIRMNSLRSRRVFMRSMATRRQHAATNLVLKDCIGFLKSLGYDLVIVETAGIGQSDSEIVDLVDFPIYVMTSDFGAPSQLEKIDMLDYAELVVLNKFDKRGAEDALRDVRKQWKRNRVKFDLKDEDVPVYPTIASQFNDPGISWMFVNLCKLLREKLAKRGQSHFSVEENDHGRHPDRKHDSDPFSLLPNIDTSLKEPRATVLTRASRPRRRATVGACVPLRLGWSARGCRDHRRPSGWVDVGVGASTGERVRRQCRRMLPPGFTRIPAAINEWPSYLVGSLAILASTVTLWTQQSAQQWPGRLWTLLASALFAGAVCYQWARRDAPGGVMRSVHVIGFAVWAASDVLSGAALLEGSVSGPLGAAINFLEPPPCWQGRWSP